MSGRRDWSHTVWPGLVASGLAAFGVAETLAYRADPTEHPEWITLSRASKQRFLATRAAKAVFVLSPWLFLYHLAHLPER